MAASAAKPPAEKFFQIILENGYGGIVVIDAKGIVRYISPSVTALHGYTSEEFVGMFSMDIVHPDDVPHAQDLLSNLLDHPADTFKGHMRIISKNGTIKEVKYRATNLLDNPAVNGIIINFQDVTHQKKIEQQLLESEAKYSLMVEKGNDGIIIAQDNLFVYVNNKALNLTGYTKDELIGTPFIRLVAPKYRDITTQRFHDRMKGLDVPHIYEIDIVAKDGTHIPVEINATLAEYQGRPASIAVIRDIRKRREVEREIRQAAKTQSALINSMGDLALLVDKDFIALDCNQAFCESLGIAKEDILGSDLKQYFPPDVLNYRIQKAEVCFTEKKGVHFQDSRDGRWFDNRFFPILDEGGSVTQLAVYIRDITEERFIRDQLAEQQKLASLGQIAAVIAHELNTPLATIGLTVQMLRDAVGKDLRNDVITIQSEVNRASTLVTDILGFSSLGPFEYEYVYLNEIVDVALNRQQQLLDVTQVTFDVTLGDGVVYGDADKLAMAFENIIKNAILARRSPHEPHTVVICERVNDDQVVVTVQDTGVGIDPQDLQNIFKPFFTTRERGGGSGLGLYIAEWVIQSHKGRIVAESTKMVGSKFTVTIPCSQAPES